jgi:hypothetical protein
MHGAVAVVLQRAQPVATHGRTPESSKLALSDVNCSNTRRNRYHKSNIQHQI